MKSVIVLLIVLNVFVCGCQSDDGIATDDRAGSTTILRAPPIKKSDPFDLIEVKRQETVLTVVVGYGGGCQPHTFSIYWNGSYADSMPLQAVVDLYHDGQGDTCEAYLTDTLTFELKDVFRGEYDVENGVHLTVRNAHDQESLFLKASER